MPYIITTYDRHEVYGTPNAVVVKERHATATLDEAREAVEFAVRAPGCTYDTFYALLAGAQSFSGERGTIGPLPNGTAIEIKAVSWIKLRQQTGAPGDFLGANAVETRTNVLDAYNARS